MKRIAIGKIIKPQGIRGEVKVNVYSGDLSRFLDYTYFYVGERKAKVEKSRADNRFAYVKFDFITDRNRAELYRNYELQIEEKDLPELDDGEYYVADLLNLQVAFNNGEPFGEIIEINTQTANTVFEVNGKNDERIAFPLVPKLLLNVDFEAEIMYIDEKIYNEVSIVEN